MLGKREKDREHNSFFCSWWLACWRLRVSRPATTRAWSCSAAARACPSFRRSVFTLSHRGQIVFHRRNAGVPLYVFLKIYFYSLSSQLGCRERERKKERERKRKKERKRERRQFERQKEESFGLSTTFFFFSSKCHNSMAE